MRAGLGGGQGYARPEDAFRLDADADEERSASGLDVPVAPARPSPVEMAAAGELANVLRKLRPAPDRGIEREEIGRHGLWRALRPLAADRLPVADPRRNGQVVSPGSGAGGVPSAGGVAARSWRFLSFSSFLRFFSSSFWRFWYSKLGFAKLRSPFWVWTLRSRATTAACRHAPAGFARHW